MSTRDGNLGVLTLGVAAAAGWTEGEGDAMRCFVAAKALLRIAPEVAMSIEPPPPLAESELSHGSGARVEVGLRGHAYLASGRSAARFAVARGERTVFDRSIAFSGRPAGRALEKIELPAPESAAQASVESILGDEWLLLEAMHPSMDRVRSRLPDLRAEARIFFPSGLVRAVALAAFALRVDADAQTCTVLFDASFPIEARDAPRLGVVVAVSSLGAAVTWPNDLGQVEAQRAARSGRKSETLAIVDDASAAARPALPFGPAWAVSSPVGITPPGKPVVRDLERPARSAGQVTLAVSEAGHAEAARRPPTPFHKPLVDALDTSPSVRGLDVAQAARFFEARDSGSFGPRTTPQQASHARPTAPKRGAVVPERTTDAIPVLHATRLSLITLSWQAQPPRDALAVVVKGTFDLVPGGPARARDEGDLPSGDAFADDDAQKGVVYPSDFALFKPRADVTLVGHAYPPGGKGTTSVARFRFGSAKNGFDRSIAIIGPRTWDRLAPSAPRSFDKVRLGWDAAFGGPGYPKNPAGAGHRPSKGSSLPLLEDPERLVRSPADSPEPACFAPISPFWRARRDRLGTFDSGWVKSRWPFFPDDFDWAYFQSAPDAQQLDYLTGDERFDILGMHAEHSVLTGALPGLRTRCFAQRTKQAGGTFSEVRLRLDTAAFDVDDMKVNLVWRGLLEVSGESAPEIQALFLMTESLASPPCSLEEARDRLLATLAEIERIEEQPPPANETRPLPPAEKDPRLVELEARVEASKKERDERLRAAGVSEADLKPQSSAKPTDPMTTVETLRSHGVRPEILQPLLDAMTPKPEAPAPTPARLRALDLLERGASFDDRNFRGADLSGIDFGGCSMKRIDLRRAKLSGCTFSGADLAEAQMSEADLSDAALDGARLEHADLEGAIVERARFDGAAMGYANLSRAAGRDASFRGAHGPRVTFSGGGFANAAFDRARLEHADFLGADVEGARFVEAELEDALFFDAKGPRAAFDRAVLTKAGAQNANFARASFREMTGEGANFEKASLRGATFESARLAGASFIQADLSEAILSRSDASMACFRRAKMTETKLIRTNLMEASLEGADLSSADLRAANLHGCQSWRAKFDGAKLDGALVTKTQIARRG